MGPGTGGDVCGGKEDTGHPSRHGVWRAGSGRRHTSLFGAGLRGGAIRHRELVTLVQGTENSINSIKQLERGTSVKSIALTFTTTEVARHAN